MAQRNDDGGGGSIGSSAGAFAGGITSAPPNVNPWGWVVPPKPPIPPRPQPQPRPVATPPPPKPVNTGTRPTNQPVQPPPPTPNPYQSGAMGTQRGYTLTPRASSVWDLANQGYATGWNAIANQNNLPLTPYNWNAMASRDYTNWRQPGVTFAQGMGQGEAPAMRPWREGRPNERDEERRGRWRNPYERGGPMSGNWPQGAEYNPWEFRDWWSGSNIYKGLRVPKGMQRWEEPEYTMYNSYVPEHLPEPPEDLSGQGGYGGYGLDEYPWYGGGGGGGGGGEYRSPWWLPPTIWRI